MLPIRFTPFPLRRIPAIIALLALLALAPLTPITSAEVPRPAGFVSAKEWGSRPDPIPASRRHTPKFVTLHHAGVLWTGTQEPAAFIRNMQAWGKRRPEIEQPPRNTFWPDVPYHFLIAPDGRVFEGRPLAYEPDSNTKYDLAGHIGVELMGNFEEQRPSRKQVEAAVRTSAWLVDSLHLNVDAVSTHKAVAKGQTSCPGRDFDRYLTDGSFHKWVEAVLAGDDPKIDLGPPLKTGPTEPIPTTHRPPDK